ncbi:preprotein translocase subunit SecE [Lactobacillus crispatus]|uniref:preprotein translocase subunit SecE n=1 Tax=Lactobacillus crispatus TaxID=47770 RepID=UPI001430C131|nr:preprotein translocase subunit SecE [Lactobacillus crispatus]NJJ53707.1 preprotein translocase subunit SecE [Lactobacillus crispatus]
MNYLHNAFKILRKCSWATWFSSVKVTLAIIAVMACSGVAYWALDLVFRKLLIK